MGGPRWLTRLALAMVLVVPLSVAGILVTTPKTAYACSCVPMTARQTFDRANAVFVGRVVAREVRRDFPWVFSSATDPAVWTFEVTRVYKGEVRRREVVSPESGASCGSELRGGGRSSCTPRRTRPTPCRPLARVSSPPTFVVAVVR